MVRLPAARTTSITSWTRPGYIVITAVATDHYRRIHFALDTAKGKSSSAIGFLLKTAKIVRSILETIVVAFRGF